MIAAFILSMALAASPVDQCVQTIQDLGAQDTRRATAVCACTGDPETASNADKDRCFQKVYGWSHETANGLAVECVMERGGATPENISICACIAWGVAEKMSLEAWKKAPEGDLAKFLASRLDYCTERAKKKVPTTTASR